MLNIGNTTVWKMCICMALVLVIASCSKSTGSQDTLSANKTDTTGKTDSVDAETGVKRNTGPITIAMVGDIMMGTTFPKNGNFLTADDGASLFKDASEILRRADIAAGNLEGAMFDGDGIPKPCHNPQRYFAFKMPERYSKHLIDAGFDFVGIANNHIHDFGPEALEGTQKALDAAGLAYAGVSDKKPVAIMEKDGRKIGFAAFGFDDGMPNLNNFDEIKRLVSGLKKECEFVIVSFHGGGEGVNFQHVPHKKEITSKDRGDVEKFAHAAIEAGADAVYGHSPHVPRAAELYKERIIFYSLGNFCTPYKFNLSDVCGLAPLAEVTLNPDGSFSKGKIHSFVQSKGVGPRIDNSNRAAKKMRELTKADFPSTSLEISETGIMSRK